MVQDKNEVNSATRWSLVHCAAFFGRLGCLQLLSKRGAYTWSTDCDGNTPGNDKIEIQWLLTATTTRQVTTRLKLNEVFEGIYTVCDLVMY